MARPLDPVSALLKLVDACYQCALIFRITAEQSKADAFQRFSGKLRATLDRFGFELQTEIRRIEDSDFRELRSYRESADDAEPLEARCESALRRTVREYEVAQAGYMPAHARAMIQRQLQTVSQLWEQFDQFQARAAG